MESLEDSTNHIDHLGRLRTALHGAGKQATFACGGKLPLRSPVPAIETQITSQVQAIHQPVVTNPVTIRFGQFGAGLLLNLHTNDDDTALSSLLCSISAAPGHARKDVDDGQAIELHTTEFCTDFNLYEHGIIDSIAQLLIPAFGQNPRGIRAVLQKLNACAAPQFKSHVGSPETTHRKVILLVCLPTTFEGGNLAVRYNGDEVNFEWGGRASYKPVIQWAAFHSDCEYEISPVVLGHCITLTYNVHVFFGNAGFSPESDISYFPGRPRHQDMKIERTSIPLYQTLQSALWSETFMPKGGVLGFRLYYDYHFAADDGDDVNRIGKSIKGVDFAVFQAVAKLKLRYMLIRDLIIDEELQQAGLDSNDSHVYYSDAWNGVPKDNNKLGGIFLEGLSSTGFEDEDLPTYQNRAEFLDKLIAGKLMKYRSGAITWLGSRYGPGQERNHICYAGDADSGERIAGLMRGYAAIVIFVDDVEKRLGIKLPRDEGPESTLVELKVNLSGGYADSARFGDI